MRRKFEETFKADILTFSQIDQAALGLSREYLIKGLDNPIVKAYHSYQVDMAVLYGADRNRAEKEMKEVLEFEFALANVRKKIYLIEFEIFIFQFSSRQISLPNEERRNATALYNPITIKELQKKYPYNKWVSFFKLF